jgi:hypothetical protein
MNGKAEKIIREKSEDFVLWTGTYRSFLEMSLDAVYYSEEDRASIWNDVELLYMEIFDTLFEITSFRETWNGPHVMPLAVPRGLEVNYWAERIGSMYNFGTDHQGFFLETNLLNVHNMRKMNDDFWFTVSELSRLGKLDFFQGTVVPPGEARKRPLLNRKSKSILYSLIQGSLSLESYYGTSEDIGSIIVRWSYNIPWDDLLNNGWRVLRNLYRINYELWKKGSK